MLETVPTLGKLGKPTARSTLASQSQNTMFCTIHSFASSSEYVERYQEEKKARLTTQESGVTATSLEQPVQQAVNASRNARLICDRRW
jgi:hypothetical protein